MQDDLPVRYNRGVKRTLLVAGALIVVAGVYFVVDVGRRARIDRGAKYHRTDFTVYQYASRALTQGQDPYEARNPRGYRYVYPPLLAILLMPVANWEPQHAALPFFLLSFLCLAYACATISRLKTGADGRRLGWRAVAAGGLVCLGFAHQGFQRGQITHVLLALQIVALAELMRRRTGRAGLWLALGGALRLTPLLPAAAVGIGLAVGALRGRGWSPMLRFGAGLVVGLAVCFYIVPVLALGSDDAGGVTSRWAAATEEVYGRNVDLGEEYKINEWRFKNQAPRRVYATWAGWLTGASFEKERPDLDDRTWSVVNDAAGWTTLFLLALVFPLAGAWLADPGRPSYAVAYAAVLAMPVLMTRYAWPTHFLMALPAVALAYGRGGKEGRLTAGILFMGTALFYAAHLRGLQPIGAAGVLMIACALFLGFFLVLRLRRGVP